jgi:UDP-2,3-diacylglucosamine pyrophosphatase LpxH
MTDQIETPPEPTPEEKLQALEEKLAEAKNELKIRSEQIKLNNDLIDTLDKQIDEMRLDMITTLKTVKALGEQIVLTHGNHSEKKIIAEVLCSEANKCIRTWQQKKCPPEYQNYRRLLREARFQGAYDTDTEF